MRGTILFLDFPEGSFDELISRLQDDQYNVIVRNTFDDVLDAIETEKPQLLIASGDFPEVTGPQLAEQVYSKLTVPIFLVLSTAGEETQTLLRRHPAIIGVYYRPINVNKLLNRIARFLNRPRFQIASFRLITPNPFSASAHLSCRREASHVSAGA